MTETAAIIHVGGEREQREILPIHIVLQVEDTRETSPGDLRFVPRTGWLLRRKEITQPALHTWPIEIATSANSHDSPGSLRSGAVAFSFGGRIFVGGTSFSPTAIVVLTTL